MCLLVNGQHLWHAIQSSHCVLLPPSQSHVQMLLIMQLLIVISLNYEAAVMIGKKSGVSTCLRVHSPFTVNIHCVAHCLALAAA